MNHIAMQPTAALDKPTQRSAAIIAGIASLVMAVAAGFAEFYARQRLIISGDAATTAHNLLVEGGAMRLGILGFVVVLVCDVLVAWALYRFFQPIHSGLSLLGAWLRLLYTALLGVALLSLVAGFRLLTSSQGALSVEQLQAQAMQQFAAFEDGWAIGLILFGLHLLCVGYLAWISGVVPKIIGALLVVAGMAYAVDSCAQLLLVDYAAYEAGFKMAVALPSVAGELGLAFWLLIKGGKGV